MRLMAWVLAMTLTSLVYSQQPITVASLWATVDGTECPRLVQMLGGLVSGPEEGVGFLYDPLGRSYGSDDHDPDADPGAWAGARVELNTWRRADPGTFVPGPMNTLFGAFGLADAREVGVRVTREGSIVARWDRRLEDPALAPMHEVVVARLESDPSGCEVWTFGPVGIGAFVARAVHAGLAIEEGERSQSDWAFADSWVRGRSELLRSLSRSTTRSAAVITPGLEAALVFWFDPAVKATSLERAAARIVPGGIPEVMVRGKAIRPAYAIAEGGSCAVVVIAPTPRDLDGVIAALGLRRVSGGDRP